MGAVILTIVEWASQAVEAVKAAEKSLLSVCKDLGIENATTDLEAGYREFNLQLRVVVAKIEQWRDLWFSDNDKPEGFFTAVWGIGGCRSIRRLLQQSMRQSQIIQSAEQMLKEDFQHLVKKHNIKKISRWRKLPKALRFSFGQQLDQVKDKQVGKTIEALSKTVDELWILAETSFRMLHGTPQGIEGVEANLRMVMKSRNLSSAIYARIADSHNDIGIDINLLNNENDIDNFADLFDWSDLDLTYRLMIKNKVDSEKGMCVSLAGPESQEGGVQTIPDNTEESALQLTKVRSCSTHTSWLPVVEGGQQHQILVQSSQTFTWHTSAVAYFGALNDMVEFENALRPSRAEKVTFAYRIVECGLFMIGTPWASHFGIKTLHEIKIEHQTHHILQIRAETNSNLVESADENIEREQIAKIGALLIGIALETNSSDGDATRFNQINGQYKAVEKALGIPYREACQFCLEPSKMPENLGNSLRRSLSQDASQSPSEILVAYYHNVFMR